MEGETVSDGSTVSVTTLAYPLCSPITCSIPVRSVNAKSEPGGGPGTTTCALNVPSGVTVACVVFAAKPSQ